MEPAFNRHLQPCLNPPTDHAGDPSRIEIPGQAENLRWQSRPVAPTDHENTLANMLEDIFQAGGTSPQDIVDGLNHRRFQTLSGESWTVVNLTAAMTALGH